MENKSIIKKIIGILLVLASLVGLYFYSTKYMPKAFELSYETYSASTIPASFDGFKIAFISDFDLKTTEDMDYLETCIQAINQAQCDMVIFGGDLYEANIFDENRLISILKSLEINSGKLAVLGENEFKSNTENCIQILEESGFEVMRNSAHYIYAGDDRITFAGLENNGNVDSLLNEEMKTGFVLSAVHQPDYFKEIQNSSSTLQLSGHSGGGFISLPWLGGIIKLTGSETYVQNEISQNGHRLMVSNGIGMGHNKTMRFNCHPNALIITLQASS